MALLGSLRAARQPTNRSCGFWSGDGGAHREAPGELAITGSHGEKSSKSGRNQVSQEYKVELMYRFDVDQQKLDNYNNKYCSSNGIVRSGTCIAKKTFGNSNGRVRDV